MQVLNAVQVAKMLGVNKEWVYQESRAGRLPHIKVGRHYRYTPEGIAQWAREQEEASVASS